MTMQTIDPRVERAGLIFAGLCVLSSSSVAAVAQLTTRGLEPLFVATATTLFGAVAAVALLALRGQLGWLASRHTPRLALIGLFGTTLAYLLFFEGAKRATAIDTTLCLQTEPLYAMWTEGAFKANDQKAIDFTTRQVADGGAELRDMIVMAWRESATGKVGWPAVAVEDVVSGKADPWVSLLGKD